MSVPFFSIIIPTHLRPQLLKRALISLRENSFQDFEVIVVSDTWDSETNDVATEMLTARDTFIKRSGLPGPAMSRNVGIELAKGQRIVFLDDDDAFLPDFLENAYGLSAKNMRSAIYTNYQIIQEDREHPETACQTLDFSVQGIPAESAYVKNFIHNHTVIYPANAIRHRRQDPRLSSLDDWDFLLNVMSDVEFIHEDCFGPLIYKDYVNPGNRRGTTTDANNEKVIFDYLHIYSKWPAPSPELQIGRQNLLSSVGLQVPLNWL